MDGEAMTGEQVQKVAKWPSRLEQISMLVGQILSPGSTLAGQLVGPASTIAGQVKEMIEDREDGDASPASEGSDASPASEG
jgi:large subunit ribosomal protein L10